MSFADRREPLKTPLHWLRSEPSKYGFAVAAVAGATLLRYGLGLALGVLPPFALFYLAIIVVALLAGFGPAIVATLLSATSIVLFFRESLSVFGSGSLREMFGLAVLSAIGISISWLAHLYRRHDARLQEFERVVETSDDMIAVVDREYRYVLANLAFLKYRGMQQEQVIGRPVSEVLNLGVFDAGVKQKVDECFQGRLVQYELQYEYPSLGTRDLFISYFPIAGPGGIDRVACVIRDISELKRAEHSLKLFRTLIDQSNDAVEVVDPTTLRFLDVNEKACKDLGYTREELLSLTVFDINPSVDEAMRNRVWEKLREEGSLVRQSSHRRKDGSMFPVESSLKLVELDRSYVVVVSRDISDRRRAEKALRDSEDQYRDLVEHSEDLVCTHDLEGKLLSVNPTPARLLGYEVEEILKLQMQQMIPAEYRTLFDEYLARIRANGFDKGLMVVMTRTGERRTWEYNNTLRTEGVATPVVRGMAHDITERRRAELAREESEQRYRLLFEKNVAGVALATTDGRVLDCNDAWARMLDYSGAEELRGRETKEFYFDLAEREALRHEFEQDNSILGRELRLRRKDGAPVWVLFDCAALSNGDGAKVLQTTAIDITERKLAEEAMRQSEERFRVALKDTPITVFHQDMELRYTWIYNPHLYWQQAIGRTDAELIGTGTAAQLDDLKRRVLKTQAALREEVQIPHDGKNYAFDITIEPLFDAGGNVVGITGAAMDIARLREMADRLQDARDKLAQEKLYLEGEIEAELGFEKIIGRSPALHDVLKKARIVAPTDSTVLLLGETGTGKELVARSVHALSARHGKNFIKLNCAAVPSGLLESELFGHEKGAFTSAVSQKIGRIELADKGTLFLDEIGELPVELQPKLLRVLQDREFERLGGVRTLHVDVRIISATNRDLRQDIAEKKFREDLFYRLNVFPIHLPSLRERRGDIPMLVHHFVHKYATRMSRHIHTIPEETMAVLKNWNWPGNVRELENMIERMVIMTKGDVLAPPPAELDAPQDTTDDDLTEMEREHILRVLRETHGVLSGTDGAASRLGIKRTTLQSMLKRFGIGPEDYRRRTLS